MATVSAPVLVLCSVLSVQTGQAIGKHLFDTVSPATVVALRLGMAAGLLLLVHRPTVPRRWRELRTVLGFGTAIAGMNLIYPALSYLPLGMATTLQLLGPITLALATSRRPLDLALAATAGVGVWLLHTPAGVDYPLVGILFALASGASMVAYLLLSKRAGTGTTNAAPLALALTWSAMLTLPFGITDSGTALLSPRVLLIGAVVAVLSAAVPYSLELAALRKLPPRTVGVLQTLEPASASLAGMVVLNEHLHALQWLAIGCVSAAATATVIRTPNHPQEPPGHTR
jgi:inner membrane transporter RhtA